MRSMAVVEPCKLAGSQFTIFLFSLILLSGCTVPYMQVDPQLSASTAAMPVSGREGWLINQQLSFGQFTSGPVKRSWTTGYTIPFILRFSGAKEQLGFSTFNGARDKAELFCLGKLRERDLPVLNRSFEVNLKTRDVFTCAIALDDESFELYSENLNQNPRFKAPTGQLKGPGVNLAISAVGSLEGGQSSWSTTALGYELLSDGEVVAAVETLNDGRVWISSELSDQHQLLAASVATALLLRSSLAEHNDDLL